MKAKRAADDIGKNSGGRCVQTTVRLPVDLTDQIDRMAKRERRNRSNTIEWLLREALKKTGEK
jgi:metal-responsive CopG/Arc/MetJ family transcriptional regulator